VIAACLIVKDAEATITACLDSIRDCVDEINVYDTGSTDGTLELLGPDVRVKRGEWRDDFAWAREQSFAMASPNAEWLLWLDADDVAGGTRHLDAALRTATGDGFLCLYQADANGYVWRDRLVRPGLRWRGAASETLHLPSGEAPCYEAVAPEVLHFVHHGSHDAQRDAAILRLQLERESKTGGTRRRTLRVLGAELMQLGEYREALHVFQRYINHPNQDRGSDFRMRVWYLLAFCRLQLGEPREALMAGRAALAERNDWPEIALVIADANTELGDWAQAEQWARRALELDWPSTTLYCAPGVIREAAGMILSAARERRLWLPTGVV
jgi:glycosyltransferase involved in cell wall biosynthesis